MRVSDRKGFGRDAAGLEELADLKHLGFRQAVIIAMERRLVPIEGDVDLAAVLGFDIRAKFAQHMAHVIDVDIRAHGMSKERMENFTMMMIHAQPQFVESMS